MHLPELLGIELGGQVEVLPFIHNMAERLADCDLIIEAVYEEMSVKKDIFGKLDAIAKPGAILASNTSYLDIEPELAVVYGNAQQPIAGYCIFNDVSARDVQAPEIIGGFCLSKDMAQGNQLGPWLVTPDEAGDVFDQNGGRRKNATYRPFTYGLKNRF
mgnify:CR=1 FL=1